MSDKLQVVLLSPQSPSYMVPYVRSFAIAQNSLAAIKNCTPQELADVQIYDENLHPIDFRTFCFADLIGITVTTATAPRSYQIADAMRAQGKLVVLGGVHATFMEEEALGHCDILVKGEAEGVWPKLLRDVWTGNHKKVYDGFRNRPETWTIPKSELKPNTCLPMHISRGCPFSCNFCCVPSMFGHKQRRIGLEQVTEAIKGKKINWPGILPFFDDNLLVDKLDAGKFCDALTPLGIKWGGMTSIDVADDELLLAKLKKSGCKVLLIGFETLNLSSLKASHKNQNAKRDYKEAIHRLHKYGISVIGSFILGFDYDTPKSIEKMTNEIIDIGVDMATFSVLTPFPGTELYDEQVAANRLLHNNWEEFTGGNVVFRPARMTPQELQLAFEQSRRVFFSYRAIFKRLMRSPNRAAMFVLNLAAHFAFSTNGLNYRYKKAYKRKINNVEQNVGSFNTPKAFQENAVS